MSGDYRHLPYYNEKRLTENEEYKEQIMEDEKQGLGVPGRSGYFEVYNAENVDAHADVTIFDGRDESKTISVYEDGSINYDYWDSVYVEWIKIKAIDGWIDYRVHFVPGVQEKELTELLIALAAAQGGKK